MSTIGLLSHAVAAGAFALLGVALGASPRPTGLRLAVAVAAFVTALWAGAFAVGARYGLATVSLLSELETARTAAWMGVLLLLQRRSLGLDARPSSSFAVAVGLGFLIALLVALDVMFSLGSNSAPLGEQPVIGMLYIAARLVLAISGLVLLHNLYVNSGEAGSLSFRLFAVGLGVIFAYDLNLYTLHFLTGEANTALLAVRGAVNALVVPLLLLALRRERSGKLHLSRQAAFHTVSFSIIGIYLIAMSLLAYGLRLTGGDWGELLQVTFLAITIIAGALVVLSPRFRAELRVRIARNFYRYRYDYRMEWLRFIEKIDSTPATGAASGEVPIRERLIEAIATVLDSPGGALLEPSGAGGFQVAARWRWSDLEAPAIAEGAALSLYFSETGRIVDFDQLRSEHDAENGGSHGVLTLPEWAKSDRMIWLAVPLIRSDKLAAIMLLQRSLAARDLNWEDYDLLRTLGRQGASYLAEAETQVRLDEARSFDEYNRRFAFVMHDVKNVVSQLGLVARNAERHADKPEFRADMIATLNSSVAKMSDLLKLMGRESGGQQPVEGTADVGRLLSVVAASLRRQHPAIHIDGADGPALVTGDAPRLEAMFTHLLQNAVDASTPDAPIAVSLGRQGGDLRIVIADAGHGMSSGFMRDELFKPFRSTKSGGFGIGAFEAREIARAHGGRMEVESRPGEGTRFTITLPLLLAPAEAGAISA